MPRAAHVIFAMLLVLSSVTAGQARHHHHRNQDAVRGREPSFAGMHTLGPIMEQLVRDCSQEIVELKTFPADSFGRTVKPDDKQAAALEDVRRVAAKAADMLATNCPNEVPSDPSGRLDAVDRGVSAVEAVLNVLQPPTQALYDSLNAEQKTRLATRTIIASGDPSRAAETSGRTRSRIETGAERAVAPVPQPWDCAQWGAELRAWPIFRIEQVVQVWPRQRAAFYELAASFQHAADAVADACPLESALTPAERMAQMRKQLNAIRRSVAIIRPALALFDGMLDGGQRKRFRSAI
jgi:hypothetical protein